MNWKGIFAIAVLAIGLAVSQSRAGTEVLGWSLKTSTSDSSTTSPVVSFFDISAVTNPLQQHTSSQVGLNGTTADYDYSWLMDSVFATFNTSLTQTFRTRRIREVSLANIAFEISQNAVFNINSVLHYSHTPNDDFLVDWQMGLRDLTTLQLIFFRSFDGGFGHFLPSTGTFSFNETYALQAGHRYQVTYTLDCTNTPDPLPTGIMDVSGFVNWNLTPEPSSLMLVVILMGPIAARRRRRGRVGTGRPCPVG